MGESGQGSVQPGQGWGEAIVSGNETGRVEKPPPRLIRSPADAEEAAAAWTRWLGFADAQATPPGADGGVDIVGRLIVGQVKAHMVPISRPDLQRLYGVAQAERKVPLFFSLMSYTDQAALWADQVNMALFRFNHAGEVEPVNDVAKFMYQRAEADPTTSAPAPVAGPAISSTDDHAGDAPAGPQLFWAYPFGCSDQQARVELLPRRSSRRKPTTVHWVSQGWMLAAVLRYDYTFLTAGRHPELRFGQATRAFELRTGDPIALPPAPGQFGQRPASDITLEPRWSGESLARHVTEQCQHYRQLVQPAAIERARTVLGRLGVPTAARDLRVSVEGLAMAPFFAALVAGPAGSHFTVLDGSTGELREDLSALFTRQAPDLFPFLSAARRIV